MKMIGAFHSLTRFKSGPQLCYVKLPTGCLTGRGLDNLLLAQCLNVMLVSLYSEYIHIQVQDFFMLAIIMTKGQFIQA